jgi:glycosyltransferase involved in cell wall biosynthesis
MTPFDPAQRHRDADDHPHGSAERQAESARPRKSLAVISTYDELCGIAAYTRFLEKQLACDFDVTVFDLNQYFLRNTHPRVRKLGDEHIKEICRELPKFDFVNIQLEHGTIGRAPWDIAKRFRWLVQAAPSLSVTFHTVPPIAGFETGQFLRELFTLKWAKAVKRVESFLGEKLITNRVYGILFRAQRRKRVSFIVHNRRDWRLMKYVNRYKLVLDHPLAFLSSEQARAIRQQTSRSRFPQLERLPESAKLVGVFGFFGTYKGFETALRAMHYLPKDHHLLFFGGVHPNEIKPRLPIDAYLQKLLDEAHVNTSVVERLKQAGDGDQPASGTQISLHIDASARDLIEDHPRNLSDRIHFMGALSDLEFLNGMAVCDAVVLPYLEVGQTSSGPISQAVELGCRVIASRTHAFLNFAKYHPNRIEFFEVGNYLELANRIKSRAQNPEGMSEDRTLIDSNRQVYRLANSDANEAVLEDYFASRSKRGATEQGASRQTQPVLG